MANFGDAILHLLLLFFSSNVSERFDKENIQQLDLASNAATTLTDTLILEDSVDPVHCTTEFIN